MLLPLSDSFSSVDMEILLFMSFLVTCEGEAKNICPGQIELCCIVQRVFLQIKLKYEENKLIAINSNMISLHSLDSL